MSAGFASPPGSPFASTQAVDLAGVPWAPDVPGIRARAVIAGGRRWAMVEYEPGARREEWCEDGHVGFVLDGAIEYEFADGTAELALHAGDGFSLATGTGHRGHCAEHMGVRLFLIDDPVR